MIPPLAIQDRISAILNIKRSEERGKKKSEEFKTFTFL
jgi:hypothetical protein